MAERTIGDVINKEIDDVIEELVRLNKIRKTSIAEWPAHDYCNVCKTKNSHYDVKTNTFTCAVC